MRPTRRAFLGRTLRWSAAGAAVLAIVREDALARVQAATARVGDASAETLASDEDFWVQIQQAYTVDRSAINLNNGGVSPSPRVVQDAMRRHLEFANELPARNMWQIQDPQVELVRTRVARLMGCESDEIALTRNASESLETCILGLQLSPGDEALALETDYPRMLTAFRQRELRDGIKLKLMPLPTPVADHGAIFDAYTRGLSPRTRVILVSHVCFVTGQIEPVREIVRMGRERGIPVIVDGAHAFAHLAFSRDELECDYYGVSLHKWLGAPHGTGFLHVRKDRVASLWPLFAAEKPQSDNIRKFEEIGTHPAANKLAIAEAATLYEAIGSQRKLARLRYLRDRWARRLIADKRVRLHTKLEDEHCGGFATMLVEGVEPPKLAEHLWNLHKIFVVAIDYAGVKGLRISPNVYTTPEEIDQFASTVEKVLARGLPA